MSIGKIQNILISNKNIIVKGLMRAITRCRRCVVINAIYPIHYRRFGLPASHPQCVKVRSMIK